MPGWQATGPHTDTYKAQKEKTVELSKKREERRATSTAGSNTLQHWPAVDATTCEHLAS